MKKRKFLSIKEYADKCGISVQQVYNRINAGLIITSDIKVGNTLYKSIDLTKYPPLGRQVAGKKPLSAYL